MASKIIGRDKIDLNESQTRMIISGWGKEVIENTKVEKITYLSDGLKVKGYIAYPNNIDKKYPCIIWNRGGFQENGAIDRFNARGIFGQIASWGYVVLASQYRGNDGGEGKEELGGADINDIINLIPLADEIPQANKKLWGIEGWSRGGMMTYLTLRKNSTFKCAVLSGAISSLQNFIETNPSSVKRYRNIIGKNNFEHEIDKRSAQNFVKKLPKIPYLLLHGGNDKTVSPLQTIDIAKRFYELNIPYRLVIFEGGDHFLKRQRKEVDLLRRNWFDKYLK